MLGSTGNTGTTKDKESILGFDHELRSLESAHCGNPEPIFFSLCRILQNVYLIILLVANVYSLIKNNMCTSTVL